MTCAGLVSEGVDRTCQFKHRTLDFPLWKFSWLHSILRRCQTQRDKGLTQKCLEVRCLRICAIPFDQNVGGSRLQ